MQTIYPIGSNEKSIDKSLKPAVYYVRKYFVVFLYTAFIFFSLKIDFDKLSFKGVRLVGYFFFQYIVGLVCLFFIANAILKI
jgi:hypothetical protein